MGRRNDHTREEIKDMSIQAAERILAEEGFAHLTTRHVAKSIGYTVGSLYMVFRNMDELTLALNARTLDSLYELIIENISDLPDQLPATILHEIARTYVQFAMENTERWKAVFMHRVSDKALLDDEYFKHIIQLFGLISGQLKKISPNSNDAQIELMARGLWASVHGITHLGIDKKLSIAAKVETNLMEVVDLLVAHTLEGLKAKG